MSRGSSDSKKSKETRSETDLRIGKLSRSKLSRTDIVMSRRKGNAWRSAKMSGKKLKSLSKRKSASD